MAKRHVNPRHRHLYRDGQGFLLVVESTPPGHFAVYRCDEHGNLKFFLVRVEIEGAVGPAAAKAVDAYMEANWRRPSTR